MGLPVIKVVSCSGADNANDPELVAALAAGSPLVEIGLQVSERNEGKQNYPSREWIVQFARAAADQVHDGLAVHAALHVNGRWCREICKGSMPSEVLGLMELETVNGCLFRRIQLNFDAARDCIKAEPLADMLRALNHGAWRPILQANAANKELLRQLDILDAPFDVLWDASKGTGSRPDYWPGPWSGRFTSWAGGLTPETAMADIADIVMAAGDVPEIGIDAERGLRTLDGRTFLAEKAAAFAAAAAAWNHSPSVNNRENSASKESRFGA